MKELLSSSVHFFAELSRLSLGYSKGNNIVITPMF
jgi:hypothetical protein